jgi:formiminoglutamase
MVSETGFIPANPSLFFSKGDPEDVRWGESAHRLEGLPTLEALSTHLKSQTPGYVLAGYPDDEGVILSGGRPGAKDAPDTIRKYFYKSTYHPSPALYDLGQLNIDVELSERHERVRRACATALQAGHKWIGMGGGHDYAYGDGAGFLDVYHDQSPVIVNFDTHVDVRPWSKGLNSGTSFRRLIEANSQFTFWEVGLLKVCNSPHHVSWAQERGARVHFWEDIAEKGYSPEHIFGELLQRPQPAPAYISIDLDVLSSSAAPGCSQTWPSAMSLSWLFEAVRFLQKACDVKVLGFYEVAPSLDMDNRTSKIVAQLIHSQLRE